MSDALLVKRDAAIEIPSFIRHWRKARECQASESKQQQQSSQDEEERGGASRGAATAEGGGVTTSSSSSARAAEDEGRHNYFHDESSLGRAKEGGGGGQRDASSDVLASDPDELADSFYFLPALKKLSSDTIVCRHFFLHLNASLMSP